ncbi:GPI transamidase component PIG-S [Eremomyces bilateralis CBS 781.70]|uniref:GPI transamidase component PIG-S n=1 Tax=Eremomyces bilateralis CBS 781.70 TaxID=1392243 RepID=A0A6G1G8A8_9PEZI|nr:GPI transamidase component PIG-S [Eremomyces bilateralis CBS 781.70]KAF1814263.1 GPI transamidase component PIG-S [Eremomyces bilateralis CBS 781.70]
MPTGSESSKLAAAEAYPSGTKKPPPEATSSINVRRAVVASFWAIVILFGLPAWWKTTNIYRASLPLREMHDWADGKICKPVFPLSISVEAPNLPASDVEHLIRTTQHYLDDMNEFAAHHLRLAQDSQPPGSASITQDENRETMILRLKPEDEAASPRAVLLQHEPTLEVYFSSAQMPSTTSTSSPLATFIAHELQKTFEAEQTMLSALFASQPALENMQRKAISQQSAELIARRNNRAFKYAPTYHLTFSLFTPTATPSSWEIEKALEEYISPLLATLSSISNFTVDTQVQLYATLARSIREPQFDVEKGAWILRNEDLSGFINAAEWPLSPSIGAGPTINFVVYVPEAGKQPLVVEGSGASSWLIPQWGSVLILNTDHSAQDGHESRSSMLSMPDLESAMATFSSHLLSLLGLPESPHSLPLRISTLTRIHAASLIFSASSTLGSLARLTDTLQSIAIPNSVLHSVTLTLKHLDSACNELRAGRFHKALEHSRTAEFEAEKAFFERSMVGQVYFPDEHKVAVYMPLLGPVAVPLLMASVKEVKAWIAT